MFKLYTQHDCPNCEELKGFLGQKGVAYEEVNVMDNHQARAFMIMNDLETTPALAIDNGQILGGELSDIKTKLSTIIG